MIPSETWRISSKFSTPRALSIFGKICTWGAPIDADTTDVLNGGGVADEGGGDGVDAQLAAKHDVRAVLLGDGRQADVDVRDVDALLLADLTAVGHDAVHVVALDVVDLEAHEAVVDQDDGTLRDLLGEVHVVEGDVAGIAVEVLGGRLGGNDDLVAGLDGDLLAVLEETGTDLGALGIEQDGHGNAELLGEGADLLDHLAVILVATVGEVEAGDVHAVEDQLTKDLLVLGSGSHGANDLGLLAKCHSCSSLRWPDVISSLKTFT